MASCGGTANETGFGRHVVCASISKPAIEYVATQPSAKWSVVVASVRLKTVTLILKLSFVLYVELEVVTANAKGPREAADEVEVEEATEPVRPVEVADVVEPVRSLISVDVAVLSVVFEPPELFMAETMMSTRMMTTTAPIA